MKKTRSKRRVGIAMLILCLVMTMAPFNVFAAEGQDQDQNQEQTEVVKNTRKVKKLKAYASYKGIQLEWKSAGKGYKYVIYEKRKKSEKKIATTSKTQYFVKVADEKKHVYRVYTVKKGVEASTFAETEPKTKVLGIKYNCVIKSTCTLECHTPGHHHTKTFKPGTKIVADEFSVGCYRKEIDGHQYAFKRIRFKSGINANGWYNSENYYSPAEMTRYVNKRGLTSKTGKLVVVSTKGQHLYLFERSNGKWKIDKHWIVSTGSPKSPTPSGITKFKYKWSTHNTLSYWSACATFSFHSKAHSWVLGKPQSGGCVRNTREHAKYIYYNYKVGTKVCVV